MPVLPRILASQCNLFQGVALEGKRELPGPRSYASLGITFTQWPVRNEGKKLQACSSIWGISHGSSQLQSSFGICWGNYCTCVTVQFPSYNSASFWLLTDVIHSWEYPPVNLLHTDLCLRVCSQLTQSKMSSVLGEENKRDVGQISDPQTAFLRRNECKEKCFHFFFSSLGQGS